MKIITSDNILLEHNIISIFTNIEKFLDELENCESDGLLEVDQKEKTKLKNMLMYFSQNKDATFIGIFYSVGYFNSEVDYEWSILKSKEHYNLFVKALEEGGIIQMMKPDDERKDFYDETFDVIELDEDDEDEDYDFADEEDDEYDLEFELDQYLEETDDEEI